MKNRNRYKEIYQFIPEGYNRESRHYKIKTAEIPDKGTRGWNMYSTRGRSMANTRYCIKAFTLIELLIVVLIIGILAAIAVPQYEKAVEKSRATQALTLLKSLAQVAETYYMANGEYPINFNLMGVEVPWTGKEKGCTASTCRDARSNADWSLQIVSGSAAQREGILLTRLQGTYKGGGFVYVFKNSNTKKEYSNDLYCTERYANGIIFEGENGSYCAKLFGLPIEGTRANTRHYVLN